MLDRRSVYCDFVRAGPDHGAGVLERADAAACGEWNGEFRCDTTNGFEKCRAAITRSSDIQHDEFIGALPVITRGKHCGVARVAKADKINALDDARSIGVETGNDAGGKAHSSVLGHQSDKVL